MFHHSLLLCLLFFFFKQKTAYEMRISDWSSDVCSSDLAPANGAFEKLPAGTAENLMKPEQKAQLTSILTYHVVPGVVTAADLARAVEAANGKAMLATLAGGNLTLTSAGGGLVVTDAKGGQARVIQPDGIQSNGVVHVVDAVLMPS